MGITVATLGSINVSAKGTDSLVGDEPGRCIRTGQCGKTNTGQNIDGTYTTDSTLQ